jgi:hypothetical protein
MKRVLWIIIILAVLTSLGVFIQRWTVETPNHTVEIVYDLPSLLEFAELIEGLSLDQLLADLKFAGVETIAIQPTSVGEMMLAGLPLPEKVWEHLPERLTDLGRVLTLPVEFDSEHFGLVEKAGLRSSPKLNTSPWDLEPIWLAYNPQLLIVSGQGSMDLEKFHGSDATLALVEFSTPAITPSDPGTMVRLHGISAPEMQVLSDERILNRYVRAVKERNMRVLYVRPFVDGEDGWERSLALLDTLKVRLESAGFSLGQAEPFAAWDISWIWTALIGAGIWATTVLYAMDLFPFWKRFLFWSGLLALTLSIVLLVVRPILAKQGLALLAAIVFPCLAMQFRWGKTPMVRYLSAALVSMIGALFVVATLSGTEFLVKIQEFRGVKLMHVAPIALVVFTLIRPLKDWLNKYIPIRHLIVVGAFGLAGALYILRTGNFGIPVLGLEVQAREFLENLLVVRPRTKELFLGHPALYFAVHSNEPRKSWWLPVAVIGQISLVNTFTHTHTFLWVSLLRTGYGLFFGYLLGWLALKMFNWGKGKLDDDLGFRILRIR